MSSVSSYAGLQGSLNEKSRDKERRNEGIIALSRYSTGKDRGFCDDKPPD